MKKATCFILLLSFVLISSAAFAGYKIILKNGKDFYVESYTDLGDKIRFYRPGGVIELDKGLIDTIKKAKAVGAIEEPAASDAPKAASTDDKKTSGAKVPELVTQREAIKNRLLEIGKKKQEMGEEDKKLTEEKKKLQEDIQKEGRITSIRERKEFEKRSEEISNKIRKFNEELNKVDEEENKLIKELNATTGEQKK